jgi:Flp pilus assembly protein TadD
MTIPFHMAIVSQVTVNRSSPVSHTATRGDRFWGFLIHFLAILVGILILLVLLGLVFYLAALQIWASYHNRAAQLALAQHDFEKAQAHLALCLEVRPHSGETQFEAARAARRAGRYREADRYLRACKDLKWVPEATDLEYVLLEIQRGNLKANEMIATDWVQRGHPDSVLILEALGQGYLKNYDLMRAIDCLTLLLTKDPDNVQALVRRGDAFERMRSMDKAIADYRKAVDLDPENEEAQRLLAMFLIASHHAVDAVAHFEKLYERLPGDPEIILGLAQCKHELGQTEEAHRLLDLVLTANPRDPKALAERGKLALNRGDFDQAESWLRKAADLAPFEQANIFSFVLCLEHQGREKEAKKWRARLDQIEVDLDRMKDVMTRLRASPKDPMLRLEAGKLLIQNGQDQEGLRWLDSALQQDPTHRPTRDFLAQYFEKRGDVGRAKHYRRLPNPDQTASSTEGSPLLFTPNPR